MHLCALFVITLNSVPQLNVIDTTSWNLINSPLYSCTIVLIVVMILNSIHNVTSVGLFSWKTLNSCQEFLLYIPFEEEKGINHSISAEHWYHVIGVYILDCMHWFNVLFGQVTSSLKTLLKTTNSTWRLWPSSCRRKRNWLKTFQPP